jgi:hypothetical protein
MNKIIKMHRIAMLWTGGTVLVLAGLAVNLLCFTMWAPEGRTEFMTVLLSVVLSPVTGGILICIAAGLLSNGNGRSTSDDDDSFMMRGDRPGDLNNMQDPTNPIGFMNPISPNYIMKDD